MYCKTQFSFQKFRISPKLEKAHDSTLSAAVVYSLSSPTMELLSPLIRHKTQEKSFTKTHLSPRNFSRNLCKSDNGLLSDCGEMLLSPIDKENKSPISKKKIDSNSIEELLSPLQSPKPNVPLGLSSQSILKNLNSPQNDMAGIMKPKALNEFRDELLSPIRSERESDTKLSKAESSETPQSSLRNPVECEGRDELALSEQNWTSKKVALNDFFQVKRNLLTEVANEATSTPIVVEDLPNMSVATTTYPSLDIDILVCDSQSKGNKNDLPALRQSKVVLQTPGCLEIAFPKDTESMSNVNDNSSILMKVNHSKLNDKASPAKLSEDMWTTEPAPREGQQMNLELIQNCISYALEDHQFNVNKRFMHMHYVMLKHFFNLKKEMKELIEKNSLNEELLIENEKLREEIKRLKATF